MNKLYWRLSYDGVGIYDALKKGLWEKCEEPKKEWDILKKSDAFIWLNIPDIHYENCCSYFTELGYKIFMTKTYPVFLKYLDEKNIKLEQFVIDDDSIDIIYKDENQIVVKKHLNC